MDDNPYQSPKSVPEVEKPPVKTAIRYLLAASYSFIAFGGFVMLQAMLWEIVWTQTNTVPSLTQKRLMLPSHVLLASPLGVLIAYWTLRAPKSKWVIAVSFLLGLSPLVVLFIGIAFFGVE